MWGNFGTARRMLAVVGGMLLLVAPAVLFWHFGGPERDLYPGANAASADAERVAADLAFWPFGAAEEIYSVAGAGGRRLAFLRREVGNGFPVPPEWRGDLENARKLGGLDLLATVNVLINKTRYVQDKRDEWRPPATFLIEGGDCDCFSAAKYVLLREMGVAANDLRITLVRQRHKKRLHVILVARTGPGKLRVHVLDNTGSYVRTALYTDRYVPLASLNENGVWLHDRRGAALATRFLTPSE